MITPDARAATLARVRDDLIGAFCRNQPGAVEVVAALAAAEADHFIAQLRAALGEAEPTPNSAEISTSLVVEPAPPEADIQKSTVSRAMDIPAASTPGTTEQECVERVMTQHWDLAACPCGLCVYGRSKGYAPREGYLVHRFAAPAAPPAEGLRLERSPDWWLAKARAEGDTEVGAGGLPAHGDEQQLVIDLMTVVREADRRFEQSLGGTSIDWVRDFFLPLLHQHGLVVVRAAPAERREPR